MQGFLKDKKLKICIAFILAVFFSIMPVGTNYYIASTSSPFVTTVYADEAAGSSSYKYDDWLSNWDTGDMYTDHSSTISKIHDFGEIVGGATFSSSKINDMVLGVFTYVLSIALRLLIGGIIVSITEQLDMDIDAIVYGRVLSGQDTVSYFLFGMENGNIYGVIGAVLYAVFRGFVFAALAIQFLYMLGMFILKGTGKGRSDLKAGLYNFGFVFIMMYLVPVIVSILVYIRDAMLNLLLSVSQSVSGVHALGICDLVTKATATDFSLAATAVFCITYGCVLVYAYDYIKIAITEAYLFGCFTLVAFRSFSDKRIMTKWVGEFIINLFVPVMDAVGLMIVVFFESKMPIISASGGKMGVITVIAFMGIMPARNKILQLFGAPIPGRGFSVAALAILASRMAGKTAKTAGTVAAGVATGGAATAAQAGAEVASAAGREAAKGVGETITKEAVQTAGYSGLSGGSSAGGASDVIAGGSGNTIMGTAGTGGDGSSYSQTTGAGDTYNSTTLGGSEGTGLSMDGNTPDGGSLKTSGMEYENGEESIGMEQPLYDAQSSADMPDVPETLNEPEGLYNNDLVQGSSPYEYEENNAESVDSGETETIQKSSDSDNAVPLAEQGSVGDGSFDAVQKPIGNESSYEYGVGATDEEKNAAAAWQNEAGYSAHPLNRESAESGDYIASRVSRDGKSGEFLLSKQGQEKYGSGNVPKGATYSGPSEGAPNGTLTMPTRQGLSEKAKKQEMANTIQQIRSTAGSGIDGGGTNASGTLSDTNKLSRSNYKREIESANRKLAQLGKKYGPTAGKVAATVALGGTAAAMAAPSGDIGNVITAGVGAGMVTYNAADKAAGLITNSDSASHGVTPAANNPNAGKNNASANKNNQDAAPDKKKQAQTNVDQNKDIEQKKRLDNAATPKSARAEIYKRQKQAAEAQKNTPNNYNRVKDKANSENRNNNKK